MLVVARLDRPGASEASGRRRRSGRVEARGLDEHLNLIVDRSPRMNYRARSTPELILKRLQSKASGDERSVYDAILAKFQE
ncbi:MAG: mismatch repair protein MutS2 [Thermoplasmata archaeon]|jgi:dsDNA-specific endonuclease/ATPase MutS2|nr:mismatch repair protein MutS2 [Thermoplasmata archaeon]